MILTFNQYINENKNDDFDAIEVNDTVQWAGTTQKVKKVSYGVLHLEKSKVNKAMWNERNGKLVKKAKEDEK